jgi:hypothetical protein
MNYTVDQFLSVFHRYNEAVWPLQFVVYALGLMIVALMVTRRAGRGRIVAAILALLWAGMSVGFMWTYFTDISGAGRVFAVLFLIGAVALFVEGVVRARLDLRLSGGPRLAIGATMVGYALVVYPLIGALSGHGYPDGPLFGLAPCPTAIFTLGVFLMARRVPLTVAAVPLFWSAIGTTAAFKIGIHEDLGLLVSGVVAGVVLVRAARVAHAAGGREVRTTTGLPHGA